MHTDPCADQPLRNRSIWVACSAKKMSALSHGLTALGATVTPLPVIEVRDIEDKEPLDRALHSLGDYSWIIFTSAYGVLYFSKRLRELQINRDALGKSRICAIGPATQNTLKELGFETDLVPARFVAEGVVEALQQHYGDLQRMAGSRVLLPRAIIARDVLPDALKAAGIHVEAVACYETVRAEWSEETTDRLAGEVPDLVVFTSSSTVRSFVDIFGQSAGENILKKSTVAAIGPITADTLALYTGSVDIVPPESTIASMIDSIRDYYSRR